MKKQDMVRKFIFKAAVAGLFGLFLSCVLMSSAAAEMIPCGLSKCDFSTQQCVKSQKETDYLGETITETVYECVNRQEPLQEGENAGIILCGNVKCDISIRQCIKSKKEVNYDDGSSTETVYECIGRREATPEGGTFITKSTNNLGMTLSGDEEKQALHRAKEAEYTDFEKKEIVDNYYKGLEGQEVSFGEAELLNIVKKKEEEAEKDKKIHVKDASKVQDIVKQLEEYANTKAGYEQGLKSPGDTKILDTVQKAEKKIKSLYDAGYITKEEEQRLINAVGALGQTALNRAKDAAVLTKEDEKVEKAKEDIVAVTTDIMQRCPTTAQYKARYGAGCWSCLVFEKLTSAFLHAANHGIKITQKAGKVLLWLGTAIWLVLWGLKNVSSFTEIQLGNIINDLLKFLFKVAFAYWFIVYSPTAISKYLITPMMSVGARIADQFWAQEIKEYTESWDTITDEDTEKLRQELMEETPEISTAVPQSVEQIMESKLSEEDKAYDAEASRQNDAAFAEMEIPNLLIPGLTGGTLTSLYGCRPRPCDGCSKTHKGVDMWVANSDTKCNVVVAAGPGTITYRVQKSGGKVRGYGYYAIIDHGMVKGNNWKTYYAHMQMSSGSPEGTTRKVKQGEPIGCIGNTGVGTGAHLHFGVFFSGKVNGKSVQDYVDPMSLPNKKICYIGDSQCDGRNYLNCLSGVGVKGQPIKAGGYPAAGKAVYSLEAARAFAESGGGTGSINYDSLVVNIPQNIKYTGPTNILPGSVMNSLLGAMRAITNTTAENMVLGNAIMCYSTLEEGGAWRIFWGAGHMTNIFMWLEGAIILCMGFMLTVAVGYYFLDISFKVGFAVLAIPVVMGLWPFGITQGKLYVAISIIAKSSALFAFFALSTYFGMELIAESLSIGGFEGENGLFTQMDTIATKVASEEEEEVLREEINSRIHLFSPSFVMMMFALIYAYKLVQQTSSDFVNKFFSDKAFGDSSPMHKASTMMTSWAKNLATKVTGFDLAKDIVANQTGRLAKGTLKKAGGALLHPVRTAKNAGNAAKRIGGKIGGAVNRMRGK